jgi:NADPH2 dehydrogenase
LGRAADPAQLKGEDPTFDYVSSSPIGPPGKAVAPRAMTIPEIEEHVQLYATAAANAVFKAGFDGVEIHGANGYLVDQFLQDVTNQRTDKYGGSIENRSRFALEVIDAVVNSVGASRTAIRFSPWSILQGSSGIIHNHVSH